MPETAIQQNGVNDSHTMEVKASAPTGPQPGTGVTTDASYSVAMPLSKIADKVTGNNPTAILLLNMCESYQQDIIRLTKNQMTESDNYRQQISDITNRFQQQIEAFEEKRSKKEKDKDVEIVNLHKEIDDLIVANSFCKKLTPVNLFGTALTLLGTITVGFAVSYDNWWLIIIFCILSVLGSLLPTIFLYLSQIKEKTRQL